jgi:hypothetical protein
MVNRIDNGLKVPEQDAGERGFRRLRKVVNDLYDLLEIGTPVLGRRP